LHACRKHDSISDIIVDFDVKFDSWKYYMLFKAN
jgi:hypothetical protein